MIIETFGPPGAGKTTFSRALAQRLRDRGYTVDLVLTLPRLHNRVLCQGGIIPALLRVSHAIYITITILCRPSENAQGLRLARELLRLMPPKNPIWWIRLSQYIIRFSCVWSRAHEPDHIVLFDQGFVQIVCTLALFSRADEKKIADALRKRTSSDLLIRFDAPKELLEQRLHDRVRQKTLMEKFFEPNVRTFIKAKPITDYVGSLLAAEDRMISVRSLNPDLMFRAVDLVEGEIAARFAGGKATRSATDRELVGPRPCSEEPVEIPAARDRARKISGQCQPELGRRLANASVLAFLVYVGGAGMTCLAQLVIAHLLGAPSYGIYSYVLAWMTFLSYVAALGFNTVLLRFVPAYSTKEKWSYAYGIILFAFGRSLFVGSIIATCGIAIVLSQAHSLQREQTVSLAIGMATVPLIALYVLGSATARAFGGVISAIAPERFVRDGLMVALVLIAGVVSGFKSINSVTVMLSLMASSAVTAGIIGLSLRKLWPAQLRSIPAAYAPRDWWYLAVPVMIMIGVEVLMSRAGVFLLGWNGDSRAAGIFALGLNLALVLVLPRMAVGTFFSPNVSKLHAHQDQVALQSLFARATVLTLVGTTTLALPLLLLTAPLLRFFGEEFVATAPIAQILVVGQIFAAATGPQQNLLTMTGHERAAAGIMVIGATVNIVGCAVGIAFYGVIGAAVATAATNVAWNTAMAIYIYKRINIIAGLLFAVAEFRRPVAAKAS